jgi:phage gp36-like protein
VLISLDDMLAAFGEEELLAITDRENAGDINQDVLDKGLDKAISEAWSYLAGRYTRPETGPLPAVLTAVICDIARYRLTGGPATETEVISERYKLAISWLKQIASGAASLPELADPDEDGGGGFALQSDHPVWAAGGGDDDS